MYCSRLSNVVVSRNTLRRMHIGKTNADGSYLSLDYVKDPQSGDLVLETPPPAAPTAAEMDAHHLELYASPLEVSHA